MVSTENVQLSCLSVNKKQVQMSRDKRKLKGLAAELMHALGANTKMIS